MGNDHFTPDPVKAVVSTNAAKICVRRATSKAWLPSTVHKNRELAACGPSVVIFDGYTPYVVTLGSRSTMQSPFWNNIQTRRFSRTIRDSQSSEHYASHVSLFGRKFAKLFKAKLAHH